ncbi:hypothetical protein B0J13DRAFT_40543 [Dactylonectria estremocensis]|uniref:Secreted protein n=1 Tax=Dactylonectria estremocensis TaxID=1079267 RepID=A0A9P9ET69_9HYPO|nr:hypothetical protein B0J13DRAFT_40543 [Dactylonectria estremocensis]
MFAARESRWWDFWPSSATRLWLLLQLSIDDYTAHSLGVVVSHRQRYTLECALTLNGAGRKESCCICDYWCHVCRGLTACRRQSHHGTGLKGGNRLPEYPLLFIGLRPRISVTRCTLSETRAVRRA